MISTPPPSPVADGDRLIPESAAAEMLGLRPQTLRTWRCQRRGPAYVRLGRAVRYRLADLRSYLDAHRVEHPAALTALGV